MIPWVRMSVGPPLPHTVAPIVYVLSIALGVTPEMGNGSAGIAKSLFVKLSERDTASQLSFTVALTMKRGTDTLIGNRSSRQADGLEDGRAKAPMMKITATSCAYMLGYPWMEV
jgi:hypothetical protein